MSVFSRLERLERVTYVRAPDWFDVGKARDQLLADCRTLASYGLPAEPPREPVPSGDSRIDEIRRQILQDNLVLTVLVAEAAGDQAGQGAD